MSNTLINVRFNVLSNMGNLNKDLAAVNAQVARNIKLIGASTDAQLALNSATSAFTHSLKKSGMYDMGLVNVGRQVDEFGKKLAKGQLSLGQYRKAIRDYRHGSEGEIREFARYQQRMLNSVAMTTPSGMTHIGTPTGIDPAQHAKSIKDLERGILNRSIMQGNESLINFGKNTQWAGRQLTVGLTVPVMLFGAASAKVFLDADKRLTNLAKVYGSGVNGASAEAVKEIKSQVLGLSKELSETTGTSLNELLDLSSDIAATGKEGGDLLTSVAETNRLMVLGDIERQVAMKATLSIQTAFGVSTKDLANEINFLNAAENATSLTMDDMAEAIPRAGTVVKALGGDVQDLALYMTAMKEGGISAAEGANALKAGLASIINPSTKAKKILGGFGIDIESIVKSNEGQLTPTILALQKELQGLDGLARSQSIAALFGKYQFARMSALFNNLGNEGSQTLEIMNLMGASTVQLAGIADKEMKQKTQSLSTRWQGAVNAIKNDMIGIGEDFVRIALPVMGFVDRILKGFSAIPGPIKTIIELAVVFAAVLGPLVMTFGLMANFVGQIKKGWSVLGNVASRMMGRGPRPMADDPYTQETVAHMMSLKNDTKAVFDHAEALNVATSAIARAASVFTANRRTVVDGIPMNPIAHGENNPSMFVGRALPTITKTSPKADKITNQMVMQLMAESVAGRPFVGVTTTNPTRYPGFDDDFPLYQSSVSRPSSGQTAATATSLSAAAASIKDIDADFSKALLDSKAGLRAAGGSDTFAAYSHLIGSGDDAYPDSVRRTGSSPMLSFIEAQGPNNQRSGSVGNGELPPGFVAGMQTSMQRVYQGGGAALWTQAMADPKLMNALKFQVAAAVSTTEAGFVAMIRSMAGNSVEAMAITRPHVEKFGDDWRADARRQVTEGGMSPDDFSIATSGVDATRPPPAKPPVAPAMQPTKSTQRVLDKFSGSLAKVTGINDAVGYQMTTLKNAAGDDVQVFRILDKAGRELAVALKNAKGNLVQANDANLRAAGLMGAGGGSAARGRIGRNAGRGQWMPMNVDVVDEAAVVSNAAAAEKFRKEQVEFKRQQAQAARAASNSAGQANWADAFQASGAPAQEAADARRRAAADMAESNERSAQSSARMGTSMVNAVGAMGLIASMSSMFFGNTQNAATQFLMIAGTIGSMLPMLNMMTGNHMSNIAGSLVSSIRTRMTASTGLFATMGRSLSAAFMTPWTAAIAGIALAIVGVFVFLRQRADKERKRAAEYQKDLMTARTNPVENNMQILGLEGASKAAKDYAVNVKKVADRYAAMSIVSRGYTSSTKSEYDDIVSRNKDLIESLKSLSDEDFTSSIKQQYLNMLAEGVPEDKAKQFLLSISRAAEKEPLAVDVIANLKGWTDGKSAGDLAAGAVGLAIGNTPDVKNTHKDTSVATDAAANNASGGYAGLGPIVSAAISNVDAGAPGDYTGTDSRDNKDKYVAYGKNIGTSIAAGIKQGSVNPEELAAFLKQTLDATISLVASKTNASGNFSSILAAKPAELKVAMDKIGVPVEQGFTGLAAKFVTLSKDARGELINTLNDMGPAGASVANALLSVEDSTTATGDAVAGADTNLAGLIAQFQAANGGATSFAGALGLLGASLNAYGGDVAGMTDAMNRATNSFSSEFSQNAQDYLDDYVQNVKDANAATVESVKETEKDKMKALRDGFEAKEKAAQDAIDKIKSKADAEIKTITDVEEKRKKAFEAEQERIRRLEQTRNYKIDYKEAVASGDLFAAGRIRNEQDAFGKSNKLDDKNAAAISASDAKIATIEAERDAKVTAAETALEAMKAADEASIESAQNASDARIKASEDAADASNDAAVEFKKDREITKKAMDDEFAAARGNVEETLRVAKKYARKFGSSSAAAEALWVKNWSSIGKDTAAAINDGSNDAALLKSAKDFTIKVMSSALGITVSSQGYDLMRSKMTTAEYFAARVGGGEAGTGQSDQDLTDIYGPTKHGSTKGGGKALATGGPVWGAGGPTEDKIPAWLSNGEFVQNASAVKHYGQDFMHAVNNKKLKFAKGGAVGNLGNALMLNMVRVMAAGIGASAAKGVRVGKKTKDGLPQGGSGAGSFSPGNYGPVNTHGPAANTAAAAAYARQQWGVGVGTWRPAGGIPGDHPFGKALDAMTSNQKTGDAISSWFLKNPTKFGTKYVIWQQRINSGSGWRGMADRGSPTQNHMDHVHVSLFNKGGLAVPQLFKGGKINYDNTIANLHKGETVLTSPLTSKFEDLAARMNAGGNLGDSPIQVIFTGPVNSEVDVEAGVTAALRKRDVRIGRDRKVK